MIDENKLRRQIEKELQLYDLSHIKEGQKKELIKASMRATIRLIDEAIKKVKE